MAHIHRTKRNETQKEMQTWNEIFANEYDVLIYLLSPLSRQANIKLCIFMHHFQIIGHTLAVQYTRNAFKRYSMRVYRIEWRCLQMYIQIAFRMHNTLTHMSLFRLHFHYFSEFKIIREFVKSEQTKSSTYLNALQFSHVQL